MKARKVSEISKSKTGIEIHPAAKIDRGFVIDHGYGTVIGETVTIGKNCYLLQGVVLGARGIANNKDKIRHPKIGDNVQIGAFTKVLGNISIGNDVFIGPNSIITNNIEDRKKIKNLNQIQISQSNSSKIIINDLKTLDQSIIIYGDNLHLAHSVMILTTCNEQIQKRKCQMKLLSNYELQITPVALLDEQSQEIEIQIQCEKKGAVVIKNFKLFDETLKNAS